MFDIIVITPETDHPHEERILHALVRAHSVTIHVRKPFYTIEEYRLYLSKYASILAHLVLHEHHSLAKEFSVKGIHLKESDRIASKTYDAKIISTSLHNIDDIETLSNSFEYIFYSPLFKSISKQQYGSDQTYEVLKETVLELKKRTNIPVIGLGGINEKNIVLVKKSGFDGAALLGAVWESEEPIKAFENCLKLKA